jgi:hypothetical protein
VVGRRAGPLCGVEKAWMTVELQLAPQIELLPGNGKQS